jgi:ubiquitin-conjugating enzyme E2 M
MLKIRQLQKKKQEEAVASLSNGGDTTTESSAKVSAAQIRLQKDITELDLPKSVSVTFPDPSDFFNFFIKITPQQGYYRGGKFSFKVEVNNNFPIEPPKIKCLNKIYHPNIDLDGNICLNILREDWSPVLGVNSVLIGLNFLFLEPNPNDPLNKEAANVLVKQKGQFQRNVEASIRGGYVESQYYDNVTI